MAGTLNLSVLKVATQSAGHPPPPNFSQEFLFILDRSSFYNIQLYVVCFGARMIQTFSRPSPETRPTNLSAVRRMGVIHVRKASTMIGDYAKVTRIRSLSSLLSVSALQNN